MDRVAVVAAALSGVLCSGVTAAVMRATEPEVAAIDGPRQIAEEQRHLAELLLDPGAPYVAAGAGSEPQVDAAVRARGVVRGWARRYTAGPDSLDALLFEFGTEDQARGYSRSVGAAAPLLAKPVPFDVPGVPDASGLADTVKDAKGQYLRLVVVVRGRYTALLVLRDDAPGIATDVVTFARRQYDALGA